MISTSVVFNGIWMKALTCEALPVSTFDDAKLWSCDWAERKLTVVRARYRPRRDEPPVRAGSRASRPRTPAHAYIVFTSNSTIR